MESRLLEEFPFLREADTSLIAEMKQESRMIQLAPGQFICMEGDQCSTLALVFSGSARVYKSSDSGREITLYHVEQGESCILTASCILSKAVFPANAITETKVEALTIPAQIFRRWVRAHDVWFQYVFELLSDRLSTVIEVIEEIAFRRLDERLSEYLLEATNLLSPPILQTTHEMIAFELGSSREVISRILKEFEREGLVSLSRGSVRIENPSGLMIKGYKR